MRVVTFGNKDARYGIILRKLNQEGVSVDNTITYWMENDIRDIKFMLQRLAEVENYHKEKNTGIKLDIEVYDYQDMKYITKDVMVYE